MSCAILSMRKFLPIIFLIISIFFCIFFCACNSEDSGGDSVGDEGGDDDDFVILGDTKTLS